MCVDETREEAIDKEVNPNPNWHFGHVMASGVVMRASGVVMRASWVVNFTEVDIGVRLRGMPTGVLIRF